MARYIHFCRNKCMNSITLTFPLLTFQFPITIELRQKLLFYPDTCLTTSAKIVTLLELLPLPRIIVLQNLTQPSAGIFTCLEPEHLKTMNLSFWKHQGSQGLV